VAVGHQGKLIWSAAVGYQDLDQRIPATPKTQYRIGSSSKAVTATGVARAVDQGFIELDAIIGDTITNWSKKEWDFSMRQLLSHTAGVGNYTDFGFASAKYTLCNCYEFKTAAEGLKVFDQYDLIFEPGTSFAYSTFDINLASVVLEQAVSTPFLEYLDNEVFTPLDMRDTYGDHDQPKTEHFATFYETRDGYYREFRSFEQRYDINLSYKWAGGGIISTPTDLVKMGNAYLKDDSFLSHDTKRNLWTPQKLNNGEVNEQDYALGWRSYLSYKSDLLLDGKTPVWMVHHGGVSKGSQNFLIIFPDYDLVIDGSINTNVEDFGTFSKAIYKIANHFLSQVQKEEHTLYSEIKAATGG
jgi:CubicO group peptidase (beta-lactamase class C family)